MKNFVMLNMEYSKKQQYLKIKNHNERKSKIDYLKNDNEKKYGDNIQKSFSSVEEIVEKRKKQMKKRASIRKNENEICEFVCAFSEEQFKNCSKEEVFEKLVELMAKIKQEYGLEPLDLHFHLDEGKGENTNVHAHLVFYNFDFKKNQSALRKMKKNDFSKMQDMVGEHFSNLNFQRGKSKSDTLKKHLKPQEFKEIQDFFEDFEKQKKEQVEFLKTLRDQIMEAKKEKNLTLEEKKEIEKDLKKIRTSLDFLRKKADSTSENIVKSSKNAFGIFDSEKLESKVSNAIFNALKLNSNLSEVDNLQKENEVLKKQNETFLKEKKEVVEKAKKYVENFKKENVGLQKTIETQKTQIEKLETKVEKLEEKIETINKNLKNVDFLNEKLNELKPTGQGDPLRGR